MARFCVRSLSYLWVAANWYQLSKYEGKLNISIDHDVTHLFPNSCVILEENKRKALIKTMEEEEEEEVMVIGDNYEEFEQSFENSNETTEERLHRDCREDDQKEAINRSRNGLFVGFSPRCDLECHPIKLVHPTPETTLNTLYTCLMDSNCKAKPRNCSVDRKHCKDDSPAQ